MMFTEKVNPTTKVDVVQAFVPRVGITSEALVKMHTYVDECADEIGWLGTAYRDGNLITIDDVFLFEQEVHATTTEITPEGLTDFAEEIMQEESGMEIWNNLKMWGHSHVNMGVSPSGQDDSQMETFKEGGHEWFIRLIANKKGVLKVDLYDYTTGVTYLDLPWVELPSEEEMEIRNEIDRLYDLLQKYEDERKETYLEDIKAEMKDKVTKKTYASTYKSYAQKKTQSQQATTSAKKKSGGTNTSKTTAVDTTIKSWEVDVIEDDDHVLTLFTKAELFDIAGCNSFLEIDELLWQNGRAEFFTDNDLETVLRVAKKIDWKVTAIE